MAGADFIQAKLFITSRFKKKDWMKMVTDMGLHEKVFILAGVAPLKNLPVMAKAHEKTPSHGMDVPDDVMNRMTAAAAVKKGKRRRSIKMP